MRYSLGVLLLFSMCLSPGCSEDVPDDPDARSRPEYWVPSVDDWTVVFRPTVSGDYINDHALFHNGAEFRLVGITARSVENGTCSPWRETYFLSAGAPDLGGPWHEEAPALARDDGGAREIVMWAPHVYRDQEAWRMVYYGGRERVYWASSTDGVSWVKTDESLAAGRDPMVLTEGDAQYLFATENELVRGAMYSVIAAYRREADGWTKLPPALVDELPATMQGRLESPFVTEFAGRWYLFTCVQDPDDYRRTLVFVSDTPTHFDWPAVTELASHAGEIVRVGEQLLLTSAGKRCALPPEQVGLSLGALRWDPVYPSD